MQLHIGCCIQRTILNIFLIAWRAINNMFNAIVVKAIKFLFIIFLICILIGCFYWFFPVNVDYKYIGCITEESSMDSKAYVPWRDCSQEEQGFVFYLLNHHDKDPTPVGWMGCSVYNKYLPVTKYDYSLPVSDYESYLYLTMYWREICFEEFLKNYLDENNKTEITYFITWGRPLEKMTYKRRTHNISDPGGYVGKPVYADTKTTPTIYVYEVDKFAEENLTPYVDSEKVYREDYQIKIKKGLFSYTLYYPYQELFDELKETWDDLDLYKAKIMSNADSSSYRELDL